MIDDDENTARGGLGPPRAKPAPIVRSTAPAGTPARPADPAAPYPGAGHGSYSDRAVNKLTPPRTVGGHTARLNVGDGDQLAAGGDQAGIDTEPPLEAPPAPPSRSVGGTMRLAPAPEIAPPPAARAARAAPRRVQPTIHDEDAPPPPPPRAAPAPAPSRPRAKASPAPVAPIAMPAPVVPLVLVEPDAGSAWLTPLSAAVGLVFFAMGSMIALVIDGRLTRPRAAPPAETAAAIATAAPSPKPAATPAAVVSAAPTVSATAVAAPVHTARAPMLPPRPPHPPPPPPPQGRNPSRPALPFK